MPAAVHPAVNSLVTNRITRPIQLLLDHGLESAALVLIYSGMETMAFLSMREDKVDLTRSDFIAWTEAYVLPQMDAGVSGVDLYGARCGVLRGTDSRLVREGGAKTIRYSATAMEGAISVPVRALASAFFRGVETCVKEFSRDPARIALVEKRAAQMLATLP